MRRGDTSTNIILFLTIIIAAMILVVWYAQTVRPTRLVIGTVLEDMQELNQHFANGCSATRYNATYAAATTTGFYTGNATHYCIYTQVYGDCKAYPYANCVMPERFDLAEGTLIRIGRDAGNLTLRRISP
jgi:hypothetical protein